jgi:hypothetical protein
LTAKGLKPDIVAYKKSSGRNRPTDFRLIKIHVEVKLAATDNPFDDSDEKSFKSTVNRRKDTKGQITTYAAAQLGLQFRTHIFSVLIFQNYASLYVGIGLAWS